MVMKPVVVYQYVRYDPTITQSVCLVTITLYDTCTFLELITCSVAFCSVKWRT